MESIKRVAVVLALSLFCETGSGQQSATPRDGYVPNESTAIRVAEAIFVPIYGQRHVEAERPFHARLAGDHWIVNGTLRRPRNHRLVVMGGTMTAEINKVTGRIVDVYHGK